ncbi:MAG: sodium:calcium antiporter, partial [Campylobacterales bacterium]|nr:sodium:calcium antiporter [Campylobacterales bacterium]
MDFLIFIISMTALIYGAELVIKESEKIAFHFNISHFIIGATLIALGTSLPEMAASIKASFSGHGEIAVSNVLGSNIFNITMVLGFVFLVSSTMNPKRDIFSKDAGWAIIPLGIMYLVLFDGVISRLEGVILLLIM